MSGVTFTSKRIFQITKGATTVTLDEDEMKQLLEREDVQLLLKEVEKSKVQPEQKIFGAKGHVVFPVQVHFPIGYKEIFRVGSDPRASRKTTFVYAQNLLSKDWGFKIVNMRGEISPFNKVGIPEDRESILGKFLRALPKDGKPLIKRRFLELGLPNVTEGRRLKALVDLADHLGFLKSAQTDGTGRTFYVITEKVKELRGE